MSKRKPAEKESKKNPKKARTRFQALKDLKLPVRRTTRAQRYLRVNGQVRKDAELGTILQERTFFESALFVDVARPLDTVVLTSLTVLDCEVVLNFSCELVLSTGVLREGTVNAFGLGFIPIDDDYLREYLERIEDESFWDQIDK